MKITRFLYTNPPFKRKTCVFLSQITHLCVNHVFSLRIPRVT
ncbi:hypothetical protein CP061683_2431 [Chlamydia psittaci 06-1683]|nr:hypothetical protein CP061683_2431 [Chlamydia psittaci 06-1683]